MNKIDSFITRNYSFLKNSVRRDFRDAFENALLRISESMGYALSLEEDRFSFSERQAFMDAWLQTLTPSQVMKNNDVPEFPTPPRNPVVSTPLPPPESLSGSAGEVVGVSPSKPLQGRRKPGKELVLFRS